MNPWKTVPVTITSTVWRSQVSIIKIGKNSIKRSLNLPKELVEIEDHSIPLQYHQIFVFYQRLIQSQLKFLLSKIFKFLQKYQLFLQVQLTSRCWSLYQTSEIISILNYQDVHIIQFQMKISIQKLLAFSLLIILIVTLPACKETYYNFMQLALTWPEQFCSQNYCYSNWRSKWDSKSFLIHGMWPSSTDLSYLSCQIQNGVDKYCDHPYNFNLDKLSWYEKQELYKYWPSLGKKDFWKYEWDTHGTCYLHIIKDEEKSSLSETQIFKKYFMETINKVKQLNFQMKPGKINSKKQFADLLGLHPSQFYPICRDDNELDEIRICYDIYYDPGNQYIINCPSSTDRNICNFPMYLK